MRCEKRKCNYMEIMQNLLSFTMYYFELWMEDGNFIRQSKKCLASTLGFKYKKKLLEIFKIKVLSFSSMCVALSFHHILTVTFFKTFFTSLALDDCHSPW